MERNRENDDDDQIVFPNAEGDTYESNGITYRCRITDSIAPCVSCDIQGIELCNKLACHLFDRNHFKHNLVWVEEGKI
jgi:hypothetical protein